MSSYVTRPPVTRPPAPAAIIAVIAVQLAALLVAGFYAAQPIGITVDGRGVTVPFGTTAGDLASHVASLAPAGDLIAVDGSVAKSGGGRPAVIIRSGEPISAGTRLFGGDVIETRPGTHEREALEVAEVPIPYETRYEGEGPWLEMSTLGAPGLRRVTRGAVSGVVTTYTVLAPPQDEVYARTRPRPGAKLAALTFDDGPVRGQTDKILDILGRERVPATFFVLGERVRKEPALTRRMVAEGHQLGNHSYNHPDLTRLDRPKVVQQVVRTRARIRSVAGSGTSWFRPPYGSVNGETLKTLKGLDQRVVMWDVDPQDWKKPGAREIAKRVVSQTRPGSIILLHDGGGDRRKTIAALGGIIRELKKRGYVFVTVQQLAEYPTEKSKKSSAASSDGYGK